jgi:hypothetical protein
VTERRCQACAHFYDKKETHCPECRTARYDFSKHLMTAKLNNHLYAQAEAQGAK